MSMKRMPVAIDNEDCRGLLEGERPAICAMPKAVLIAECQSDNLGDQAITAAIRWMLAGTFDVTEVQFGVLAGPARGGDTPSRAHRGGVLRQMAGLVKSILPRKIMTRLAWHLSGEKNRSKSRYAACMEAADIVLIGGGQLIRNNQTHFCQRLALIGSIASRKGIPTALMGVGVDRKMDGYTWNLVRDLLQKSVFVATRDSVSRQRILDHLEPSREIAIVPDLAFGLAGSIGHLPFAERKKHWALNVMHFPSMLSQVDADAIAPQDLLDSYLRIAVAALGAGYDVSLFTSGVGADLIQARAVQSHIRENTGTDLRLVHPERLDDLYGFLGKVGVVLASRMHAGILAYGAGCNPVCIDWDDKVSGVWAAAGQANRVVSMQDFADPAFAERFLAMSEVLPPPSDAELAELSAHVRTKVLDLVVPFLRRR